MRKSLTCLLFAALSISFLLPLTGVSQDRETLTNRGGSTALQNSMREFFKKPKATPRPAKRVFLNTHVYRYEDRVTVNHDTASSPEIIFHVRDGRVVPGHAFDY